MSDIVEMDLSVALAAARKCRALIEDAADADDSTKDAATLRRVYAHLLDVTSGVAGALAVIVQRRELQAVFETADTERPLRLVQR